MTDLPINRYEIDEKNAIIALQAILTTRGEVTDDKYEKLALYLGRLPPYRALLVYGHAMHAIANRLDEDNPYRGALKTLGQTITDNIDPQMAADIEKDPRFYESERPKFVENLNKISTLMQQFGGRVA